MSLIGVLGKKGSGKDTVSDYISEKYDFQILTLAKPLKEACRIIFNLDEEQLYGSKKETIDNRWGVSPRILFQYLGTDVFRNDVNKIIDCKNNFWINNLRNRINSVKKSNPKQNIIISDLRFQNEVDLVKELGGTVIKIVRLTDVKIDHHESENIDVVTGYDHVVQNNSTFEVLYNKIDDLVKNI